MSNAPEEYDAGPLTERVMVYRGRNSRYFNVARKAALYSEQSDYKHGAVVVKGGSVINTSCNKNRLASLALVFVRSTTARRLSMQSWALFLDLTELSQKVRPSM